MKKYIYCFTFLLSLLVSNIIAQSTNDGTSAKSAIYFNDGTAFVYSSLSINYDHRIRQSEKAFFKNYYLNFRAGFFNRNSGFASGPSRNGLLGSVGVIGLTGSGNGHFEAGVGVALHAETDIDNDELDEEFEEEVFVLPDVSVGYRYQKAKGFMIRVGVGFPRGIFFGLGYSF